MTELRNPSLILPVAVAVSVLLARYVGAYYRMVDPFDVIIRVDPDEYATVPLYWSRNEYGFTGYNSGTRWETFFAPINWLDRHVIRRSVWMGR